METIVKSAPIIKEIVEAVGFDLVSPIFSLPKSLITDSSVTSEDLNTLRYYLRQQEENTVHAPKNIGVVSISLCDESLWESREIVEFLKNENIHPLPFQYLLGAFAKYENFIFDLYSKASRIVGASVVPTQPYGHKALRLCLRKKIIEQKEHILLCKAPCFEERVYHYIIEYKKSNPYNP